MVPPLQGIPSIVHPTTTLCGNDTVEEIATRIAPRVTESPACGCFGVVPTAAIAQSVSLIAGGGRAGTIEKGSQGLRIDGGSATLTAALAEYDPTPRALAGSV